MPCNSGSEDVRIVYRDGVDIHVHNLATSKLARKIEHDAKIEIAKIQAEAAIKPEPELPIFTYCESELVPEQFHEFHLTEK